eukprot:gene14808-biopygen5142
MLRFGGGGLGDPPGSEIHQNLENSDFLGVPPGSYIRPRWDANGHRNRFFGRQMAIFCVRSAPTTPGARCICIGAVVYAGIRFRHSEPKTRARAELTIGGLGLLRPGRQLPGLPYACCAPEGGGSRGGPPGAKTHRNSKIRLHVGAARVPYPTPMGCQRTPIPVFFGSQMLTFCVRTAPATPGAGAFALEPLYMQVFVSVIRSRKRELGLNWRSRGPVDAAAWPAAAGLHVRDAVEGGGGGLGVHQAPKSTKISKLSTSSGCRQGAISDPAREPTDANTVFFYCQMASFCVRSAPASPGARCVCLGPVYMHVFVSTIRSLCTCCQIGNRKAVARS